MLPFCVLAYFTIVGTPDFCKMVYKYCIRILVWIGPCYTRVKIHRARQYDRFLQVRIFDSKSLFCTHESYDERPFCT